MKNRIAASFCVTFILVLMGGADLAQARRRTGAPVQIDTLPPMNTIDRNTNDLGVTQCKQWCAAQNRGYASTTFRRIEGGWALRCQCYLD